MRKILGLILMVCFMPISAKGQEKIFNPDGYYKHPSLNISTAYTSWQSILYYHYMIDPYFTYITYYDTIHQNAICYNGNIYLPISRNATIYFGYNLIIYNYASRHTICGGAVIYTSAINQQQDFINPDGKTNSFVLFPMIGFNVLNHENWYGSSNDNGLLAGLQISYIATHNLTINSAYMLDRLGTSTNHKILMGCSIHINSKAPNTDKFNSDGQPGSICFSPNIGYMLYDENISGVTTGIEAKVPLTELMSIYAAFQYDYEKQKEESFMYLKSSKAYNFGIGLSFHF